MECCASTLRNLSTAGQISPLECNCYIKTFVIKNIALYNFDGFLNFPSKICQYCIFEEQSLWSRGGGPGVEEGWVLV